jgi:hypothetical protein
MKKYLVVVVMLVSMAVVAGAQSVYPCTGTVTSIAVATDGSVNVVVSGGPTGLSLCQIGVASSGNGWTAESCKAAYATLLAARLSGLSATIWFQPDGLTCSTQPAWNLNNKAYLVAMSQ